MGSAPDPDSSAYKEYWNRLDFEHELLNRRITWLLSSQALLFAAYGLTFTGNEAEQFRAAIAWSGMIVAILILLGILAGLSAKLKVWLDYKYTYYRHQPWGVRTGLTCLGLVPDVCSPVLFAVVWLVVLGQ